MSLAVMEARASKVGFQESYIEFESCVDQLHLFGMDGLWCRHALSRVSCMYACMCACVFMRACPSVRSNNFQRC